MIEVCILHGERSVIKVGEAQRSWVARSGWVLILTCACHRFLTREQVDEEVLEREFHLKDGKVLPHTHYSVKFLTETSWAFKRAANQYAISSSISSGSFLDEPSSISLPSAGSPSSASRELTSSAGDAVDVDVSSETSTASSPIPS